MLSWKVTFLEVEETGRDEGGSCGASALHSFQVIIAVHLHGVGNSLRSLMHSNLVISGLVVHMASALPFALTAVSLGLGGVVQSDAACHLAIGDLTGDGSLSLLLVGTWPHHRLTLRLGGIDHSIVPTLLSAQTASRHMLSLLHVFSHDFVDGLLTVDSLGSSFGVDGSSALLTAELVAAGVTAASVRESGYRIWCSKVFLEAVWFCTMLCLF